MATESKNNSQEKIFVGIDVGTRNWAVSMVSSEGELLERMNVIEAEFEIFRKIFSKYSQAEIHSVYEAGRSGISSASTTRIHRCQEYHYTAQ